jgi:hypothetical protein
MAPPFESGEDKPRKWLSLTTKDSIVTTRELYHFPTTFSTQSEQRKRAKTQTPIREYQAIGETPRCELQNDGIGNRAKLTPEVRECLGLMIHGDKVTILKCGGKW